MTLCSVCSGAFVLAEPDQRPPGHHTFGLCPAAGAALSKGAPRRRTLVFDEGDIITAGGILAWVDLGLTLVSRLLGAAAMLATARFLLIVAAPVPASFAQFYVKPFVEWQKNDAADAEAIAEAASRPTMRFVQPKSEKQQARAMVFRTRDLLVRQRTQLINAVRAHLAEHGVIAAQGITNVAALGALIEQAGCDLDLMVVETVRLYLDQIEVLSARIATLEKVLKLEATRSQSTVRLMTMPGIGPVTAMAVDAFAPTMTTFRRGRDFAAWLGLVPRQHSSGGKQVPGRTIEDGAARYSPTADHRSDDHAGRKHEASSRVRASGV